MAFYWQDLFRSLGGEVVFLAATAWLLRAVIADRLKANSDIEIERVKSSLAQEAKSFELKIKADADAGIERLRQSLEVVTHEHQIRFSQLHQKRAEIIADLYKRLVDAQREGYINIMQFGRRQKDDEGRLPALTALQNFDTFADQHRIYFPQPICQLIDQFSSLLREPLAHAMAYGDIDPSDPQMAIERRNVFKKALEDFRKEIPAARRELEREFREVLGS